MSVSQSLARGTELLSPDSSGYSFRSGFSFLEILFATIIIGIGFIMVAAVFPVAIQQTQVNVAESESVAMSRSALRYLQAGAETYIPAPSGGPVTIPLAATSVLGNLPTLQQIPNSLISNFVQTQDRRFAWTGFYRRDTAKIGTQTEPAPYAQVWIITAQVSAEGQTSFGSAPLTQSLISPAFQTSYNFFPSTGVGSPYPMASVTINSSPPGNSTITFNNYPGSTGNGPVRDGAFVLITAAPGSTLSTANQIVGWYSRLGVAASAASSWYLQTDPPSGIPMATYPTLTLNAFVLGKPQVQVSPGVYQFLGPAQDISCTSGFIRVNN